MKKISLLVTIVIAVIFTACSVKLYEPTEVNVNKRVTASLRDMKKGKAMYAEKCGQCHRVPKPEKFSVQKFTEVMAVMGPKANLLEPEQQYIIKYVVNHNGKDK
jgi:hypothetical protein